MSPSENSLKNTLVLAVSHLHWYWQIRTTKRQNTYKTQTNETHKMAIINNNTLKKPTNLG